MYVYLMYIQALLVFANFRVSHNNSVKLTVKFAMLGISTPKYSSSNVQKCESHLFGCTDSQG